MFVLICLPNIMTYLESTLLLQHFEGLMRAMQGLSVKYLHRPLHFLHNQGQIQESFLRGYCWGAWKTTPSTSKNVPSPISYPSQSH